MTAKPWLGWHFCTVMRTLRYGDDRKIVVGKTHKVKCDPVLCEAGLHASPTVWDALQYAPGPILHRVQLSGKIVFGDDKVAATERKYLAAIDATPILRAFTRKCALQVIHLWKCPRIVQDYLETGDETKRAAASAAARDAERDAAWYAESAAASAAVSAAERDTAWYAARDAAMDAASAAARDAESAAVSAAARDVERDAASAAAAGSAASAAAGNAARDAQKQMLETMVLEVMR